MAKATEALERAEHAAHAAHQGEEGDGHGGSRFTTQVGITMAALGVLLAFASAKVGGERAELVKALVDQQHAHSKYQAQDIKHRLSVLTVRQMHATTTVGKVDSRDMVALAQTADRYLGEQQAASAWVESYDPIIRAHTDGQEDYELAQLAAEFGIVVASISLLLRRRLPWLVAMLLGVVSVAVLGATWIHVRHQVHQSEEKIVQTGNAYRELRTDGKTTEIDQALIDDVLGTHGTQPAPTK